MRGMKLLLIFASVWLVFSSCLTTTVQAETTEETPATSVGIETIIDQKDNTEVTLSYALDNQKEVILKTDQENMIDVNLLKEELGADKVKEDSNKKELTLTLDDPEKIDFKMYVDKKTPFLLTALQPNGEEIFNYKFHEIEPYNEILNDDDDPSEEATWTRTEKLRVSEGPVLEHTDGSMTQPYLYFGDYQEASAKKTIDSSWEPRGKSHRNSLTAPNSAILFAEPGSRIQDGLRSNTNHIYTTHYGDNQSNDTSPYLEKIEDFAYGSPTSYISNDLYDYVKKNDDWDGLRPGTSGPNKLGQSYAMLDTPRLYYRVNPKTGFEEQRLVFKQRAYWADKKNRVNPEITTTVKLSFTKTGKVITNINFKNTGKVLFKNFIGFSNQDLSLNKDGQEIRDIKGKKIGNYIPMRALGNRRGMYMQTPNNEIRTSIYTNHTNGAEGWAARSASRSYLATKGFMYNPGILGLVLASSETYYPWKVGKPKNNTFFDDKAGVYKFPYTQKKVHNAFANQEDAGDNNDKTEANERLGVTYKNKDKKKDQKKAESVPQFDSGLTMRTRPVNLDVGRSVQLEYGTMTDVPGTSFNPVVEHDNLGTEDHPQIVPLGAKELEMTGHLYDFDSNHITLFYGVDSDEEREMENVLTYKKQTNQEAESGKFHEFKETINIKDLERGSHKLHLIAIDEDGNESVLQEHVFKIIQPATREPQIEVTSPNGPSKNSPYSPLTDHFGISGFWSDKDSSSLKSITYKIDDGEQTILQENLKNTTPGTLVPWKIDDLDVKKFNDFEVHTIQFDIIDSDDNHGTAKFYFRHIGGSIHLVAPEEIDFGQISVTPTSGQAIKPNMKDEKVLLEDFREKGANPVGLSLSIDTFYKTKDDDHDDEDDGDDSGDGTGDPDYYRQTKESLLHDVYWDGKVADSKNLLVGQTTDAKNEEWQQTTDFTDDIVKKLKLSFRSDANGSSVGKYVSHWTWQTVDSVS